MRGATRPSSRVAIHPSSFQFTHPVRGATIIGICRVIFLRSFNSRTPCGVRQAYISFVGQLLNVSIHAPRAGCDRCEAEGTQKQCSFNSRTPCGVRLGAMLEKDKIQAFQFTHPVRGATPIIRPCSYTSYCFNSRTPCGVRPQKACRRAGDGGVSIHAPRAGCDLFAGFGIT